MCVCVFVRLLPEIELILAVGLKLSTKSDIKLPRSYKQRPNEREKTKIAGQKIKLKYLVIDTHDMAAHTHTHTKTHTNPV